MKEKLDLKYKPLDEIKVVVEGLSKEWTYTSLPNKLN